VLQLADLYVFKFGLLPLVLPLAAALAALALALALAAALAAAVALAAATLAELLLHCQLGHRRRGRPLRVRRARFPE